MKYADWIAVYAAVVATAVAFWNVYIYFRQGVRIEVQALPDFQMFGPSLSFSGDRSEGGKEKVIIVEAVNVGGRKTTLTHLVVYVYESRWNRLLRKKPVAYLAIPDPRPAGKLPHELGPGERWTGLINQSELIMYRDKVIYCGIVHALDRNAVFTRLNWKPDSPNGSS